MKQIYGVISNNVYDVKRFGSSALNYVGRRWVVVRQSTIHNGRVYVNEVGGDGHRVTARGYRKIESAFGQLAVGTQFVVSNASPVAGSGDCIRIRITAVPDESLGGCPDASKSPCGCGGSSPATPSTPSVPGTKQGYAVINGVTYTLVK